MTIITAPRATKPRAISIDGEEVMEEVLLPKVVEEDIRLVEEQLPARGTRDELLQGRILQLKFLDRVSEPVQTANVLRGINDECLKLALVDSAEEIVNCGPAEAEIVLLNEGNGTITHENFKRRIIKTGEKKKPHFTKRVFIDLKEGVGDLAGLQLGQDSGWTKNCYCRLGATLVQSPGGIVARSAWTPPFKVGDKSNTRNKKHESPLLSSTFRHVWRLKKLVKTEVFTNVWREERVNIGGGFSGVILLRPYSHDLEIKRFFPRLHTVGGLATFEDCLHQVENGLICNDDMTFDRAFCVDEMQYFETDTLDLSDDIQGAIYLCLYSY